MFVCSRVLHTCLLSWTVAIGAACAGRADLLCDRWLAHDEWLRRRTFAVRPAALVLQLTWGRHVRLRRWRLVAVGALVLLSLVVVRVAQERRRAVHQEALRVGQRALRVLLLLPRVGQRLRTVGPRVRLAHAARLLAAVSSTHVPRHLSEHSTLHAPSIEHYVYE